MTLKVPHVVLFILLILTVGYVFAPFLTMASTSTNTLYAHAETTTIAGSNYYRHLLSAADGNGTILSQSAVTAGRKLMGKWVYPLNGILSIPASAWSVTYRAQKSASASSVVAHGDVDVLIRKASGSVGTTIAPNVANSQTLTLVNTWETLTGTYSFPGYTVVDQTDYLEVDYYIEVTTPQNSKSVRLMIDNAALAVADQTKVSNVVFQYPNQAPVASFTFSPSNPIIEDQVSFDASASYDSDGSIVSYQWDFGDGNVTTVATPTIIHVYTVAGSTVNYTVALTVTDNEGATGGTSEIVPVTNPSILYVSLPEGSYNGPDPDIWLSQAWLLSTAGASRTFTVRVEDTSGGVTSYDTHLLIALNDAAYNSLTSLSVGATPIPKSSFVYGTPTPYGFTITWENDVYPTWFSDIYVVGDIAPKSYVDVQVSVSFSSPDGVRVHFDAYGSTEYPPPSKGKHVTHNPHEKDSTALFSTPPVVQYYLTVRTDPLGVTTIPGEGWYDQGTSVILTAPTPVSVSPGVQYRFDYWDVDGASRGTGVNPNTVIMDADHTATAHYVLQYYLTVSSPFGTTDEGWYDAGTTVYATVTPLTVAGPPGVQYVFAYWSGDATGTTSPSDPIILDGPKTAIANWQTQYYLTVVSPSDTPGGEGWYDSGATAYATLTDGIVSGGAGTRFVFTGWSGDASGTGLASDPIIMDSPKTATANWKTQFYLTVNTNPAEVLTLNPMAVTGQGWYDSGTTVTVDAVQIVDKVAGQSRYDFRSWTGASPTGVGNQATVIMDAPKTATANYQLQYKITFGQTGIGPDFTGTIVTVDGTGYNSLSAEFWWDSGSSHTFAFQSPLVVTANAKQYVWTSTTGLSNVQSGSIMVSGSGSVTGNYKTQYYLTVSSPYGSPSPVGWVDAGMVTASVVSPSAGPPGTRYVCTGWSGTGSVPPSGTASTVSFTLDQPSSITWTWKTQYLLTVATIPAGLTPPPTRNPTGEAGGSWWYDATTSVTLTAQPVTGYTFGYWDIDGYSQGSGVNPVSVGMNSPHTATAYYSAIVTYSLTIPSTTGGTTNPTAGTYSYTSGATVSVQATPDANYLFAYWELDGSNVGSANPINVLMDSDHTLRAVFTPITYTLTVSPATGGSTNPGAGTYSYNSGSSVSVQAIASTNYIFDHWELDGVNVGSSNPYNLLMDGPHTLRAVFRYQPTGVGGVDIAIAKPRSMSPPINLIALLFAAMAVGMVFISVKYVKRQKHS